MPDRDPRLLANPPIMVRHRTGPSSSPPAAPRDGLAPRLAALADPTAPGPHDATAAAPDQPPGLISRIAPTDRMKYGTRLAAPA